MQMSSCRHLNADFIISELISTRAISNSCGQIQLPMCRQAVSFRVLCMSSLASSCCSKMSQVSCKFSVSFSHPLWFSLWCSHTLKLSKWHKVFIFRQLFFPPFTVQFPRLPSALQADQFKEPTTCWIPHIHLTFILAVAYIQTVSFQLP